MNNQEGTFTDITVSSGLDGIDAKNTISAAFSDYDLDGDLDLFLTHWGTERPWVIAGVSRGDTETLWDNVSDIDGVRFFSKSVSSNISDTLIAGRGGLTDFGQLNGGYDYSFTPILARLNSDRYPDFISVGDFVNTRLFMSNAETGGTVTFNDISTGSTITDQNGMGSVVGDIDNDGDLDWFVSSIANGQVNAGNHLYINDGEGTFDNQAEEAGVIDGG
ncbi:MAG: hypothetical protein ACI93R_000166 [Flavobacteriales bacterium]|jgi:hypothetical protein